MYKKWKILLGTSGVLALSAAIIPTTVACTHGSGASNAENLATLLNTIPGQQAGGSGSISVNGIVAANTIILKVGMTAPEIAQDATKIQAIFQSILDSFSHYLSNNSMGLSTSETNAIANGDYSLYLQGRSLRIGNGTLTALVNYQPKGVSTPALSTTSITLSNFGLPVDEANYLVAKMTTANNGKEPTIPTSLYRNLTIRIGAVGSNPILTNQKAFNWIISQYVDNQYSLLTSYAISGNAFTVSPVRAKVLPGGEMVQAYINFRANINGQQINETSQNPVIFVFTPGVIPPTNQG